METNFEKDHQINPQEQEQVENHIELSSETVAPVETTAPSEMHELDTPAKLPPEQAEIPIPSAEQLLESPANGPDKSLDEKIDYHLVESASDMDPESILDTLIKYHEKNKPE